MRGPGRRGVVTKWVPRQSRRSYGEVTKPEAPKFYVKIFTDGGRGGVNHLGFKKEAQLMYINWFTLYLHVSSEIFGSS
jgi:hypothetical protein